ncbi:hypothetical protein [Aureibacter tunicatorum]|uniref:Transposase/invertase (TIGR01784 family) n=1 Tax=Aureibacter tunicatorum TaxID=866807 RepID=A0AAE4BV80_9BACT|nr:hypothetical protein [Aureibacter tunicatorum]MDR6241810.1 putative transposase/invertase (TIGR01784 family) [Aureibacter tunicatorum]BDD07057.1 hypothetical protein AUTU_45400 [Aureibacter tunicatorum]
MRDYYNTIETAKLEAREEGKEEGLQKGLEKGKKEEKVQIAKSLIALGLSVDQIMQATSLATEDIEKLK